MTSPLIECEQLLADLDADDLRICDCRHNLAKPEWGREVYSQSHVPGAVYVDLERDLSGPPLTDSGRHPMPSPDSLRALFERLGISERTRVVVYDHREGAIAARLWWQLRYMGHASVQLLNGGFEAWQRGGHPVTDDVPTIASASFNGTAETRRLVTRDELASVIRLLDARDERRYRGELEPIDPVAGHIPSAHNLPFAALVDAHGRFQNPELVRAALLDAFDGCDPRDVTYSCGSGVTACHLAVAACYAGLDYGRLYGGSFSEWCRTPGAPIATGAAPGSLAS